MTLLPHTLPLIASAPLLLVIVFVTSTPESYCQCSFCYYRLPQLPRVNANVSNNRMHVTYHEPGRFRWMLKVQRGKGNVPVWIMWTFQNHVRSCVTETRPNANLNPLTPFQQVYNLFFIWYSAQNRVSTTPRYPHSHAEHVWLQWCHSQERRFSRDTEVRFSRLPKWDAVWLPLARVMSLHVYDCKDLTIGHSHSIKMIAFGMWRRGCCLTSFQRFCWLSA